MTTHALSNDWLTDTPFIAGQKVRIREIAGVPYNDGATRRWFNVCINDEKSVVLLTNLRREGQLICSDHEVGGTCDCREAVRRFMESDE